MKIFNGTNIFVKISTDIFVKSNYRYIHVYRYFDHCHEVIVLDDIFSINVLFLRIEVQQLGDVYISHKRSML